jgi:hypothetical protein
MLRTIRVNQTAKHKYDAKNNLQHDIKVGDSYSKIRFLIDKNTKATFIIIKWFSYRKDCRRCSAIIRFTEQQQNFLVSR